jgi:hypothetical protein
MVSEVGIITLVATPPVTTKKPETPHRKCGSLTEWNQGCPVLPGAARCLGLPTRSSFAN